MIIALQMVQWGRMARATKVFSVVIPLTPEVVVAVPVSVITVRVALKAPSVAVVYALRERAGRAALVTSWNLAVMMGVNMIMTTTRSSAMMRMMMARPRVRK
jgi:hypothetical protein